MDMTPEQRDGLIALASRLCEDTGMSYDWALAGITRMVGDYRPVDDQPDYRAALREAHERALDLSAHTPMRYTFALDQIARFSPYGPQLAEDVRRLHGVTR